jgi:hypothetical protein
VITGLVGAKVPTLGGDPVVGFPLITIENVLLIFTFK